MYMHTYTYITCYMHSYRYVENGARVNTKCDVRVHQHPSRRCIALSQLPRVARCAYDNMHAKEPYISTKEAYISAKEAYISAQLHCSLASFTVFLNILTLSLFHSLSFAKTLYRSPASSTRGTVRLQFSALYFSIYLSLQDVVLLCRISTKWCAYGFSHSLVLTLSPSPRRCIALSRLLHVAQCA